MVGGLSENVKFLITEIFLLSGMETLRSPSSNLSLKFITYALGTRNYACSPNSTLPPVPIGSNAKFVNATKDIDKDYFYRVPQLLISTETSPSTSFLEQFGSVIGNESSDASLLSTIYLNDLNIFQGRVFSTASAYSNYSTERNATDWVALTTMVDDSTVKEVYCVQTAGEQIPLQCGGLGGELMKMVSFAAQYWFYG